MKISKCATSDFTQEKGYSAISLRTCVWATVHPRYSRNLVKISIEQITKLIDLKSVIPIIEIVNK